VFSSATVQDKPIKSSISSISNPITTNQTKPKQTPIPAMKTQVDQKNESKNINNPLIKKET